jgi:hypothetical protein
VPVLFLGTIISWNNSAEVKFIISNLRPGVGVGKGPALDGNNKSTLGVVLHANLTFLACFL